jgi:hypothetical protein
MLRRRVLTVIGMEPYRDPLQQRNRQLMAIELQAAEGFAALGDHAAVQNCLVMATRLADDDPQAQASIRAFSDRFTAGDDQRRVSSSLKRAATIPSSPGSRLNGSTATSSK